MQLLENKTQTTPKQTENTYQHTHNNLWRCHPPTWKLFNIIQAFTKAPSATQPFLCSIQNLQGQLQQAQAHFSPSPSPALPGDGIGTNLQLGGGSKVMSANSF